MLGSRVGLILTVVSCTLPVGAACCNLHPLRPLYRCWHVWHPRKDKNHLCRSRFVSLSSFLGKPFTAKHHRQTQGLFTFCKAWETRQGCLELLHLQGCTDTCRSQENTSRLPAAPALAKQVLSYTLSCLHTVCLAVRSVSVIILCAGALED